LLYLSKTPLIIWGCFQLQSKEKTHAKNSSSCHPQLCLYFLCFSFDTPLKLVKSPEKFFKLSNLQAYHKILCQFTQSNWVSSFLFQANQSLDSLICQFVSCYICLEILGTEWNHKKSKVEQFQTKWEQPSHKATW
jgi:hypothetical protein